MQTLWGASTFAQTSKEGRSLFSGSRNFQASFSQFVLVFIYKFRSWFMLHTVLPEKVIVFFVRRRLLRHLVGNHGHQSRLDVGLALARNLKSP